MAVRAAGSSQLKKKSACEDLPCDLEDLRVPAVQCSAARVVQLVQCSRSRR
jgi:hypothetical protein